MHRSYTRINVAFYKLTGGRIFGRFAGLPVLLIETTGRKSGRKRTTPLVFMDHPIGTLLVASDGGSRRHPNWFVNLRNHPTATVWKRGERFRVHARELSQHDRDTVWPELCRHNKGLPLYQAATDRRIPVVVLEPKTS